MQAKHPAPHWALFVCDRVFAPDIQNSDNNTNFENF